MSEVRILDISSAQLITLPGSAATYSPRWSPDGRFIAGSDTMLDALKVFDFDTQRWSILTKHATAYPTFSRDGQFIYFLLGRPEDEPGVYRIRVANGDVERVIDTKGFRHSGYIGVWMGLDPTDSPMLLRDIGSDDIYALTLETR